MYRGKVFCIGFQKTGTSSMGRALTMLGYRVCGAVGLKEPNLPERIRDIAFSHVADFDAFQDNPWPLLYKELDQRYPGSKFILTRRDPETWIRSVLRHFGHTPHPMQEWIYDVAYPEGNEETYLRRYKEHNEEVVKYFAGREDDLLVIDIEKGDQWGRIAAFLDAPIPAEAFPHANKGGAFWKSWRWLKRAVARANRRVGLAFRS